MSLLDKMLKSGSKNGASVLSESLYFNNTEFTPTNLPILNIAFSGSLKGGLTSGLTILAGESKTFKSALALYCLKSYLDRYKDAIGVLYDSEFGITPDYIKSFGIDPSRVIHIPVEHVEQLKFDIVKKLDAINRGERVFFLVDSIGQISSKKEVEDAIDEKSVADMTRAKSLRSLLRLVTIQLNTKNVPCIMINHVYQSIGGMYPSTVIPGGTAVTYSANQIFVITKAQEKATDGSLDGWKFTINIFKSRFVKEKAKLPFTVLYEKGIQMTSGLLDIALESGHIIKPSMGWYQRVNMETGEIDPKKFRAKETDNVEFWVDILKSSSFNEFVESRYQIANGSIVQGEEIDSELDKIDTNLADFDDLAEGD